MKRSIVVLLLAFLLTVTAVAQTKAKRIKYGSNPAAGKTFTHDGVKFYYEVYGKGEPLLLAHGNGGSILDIGAQIEHFRTRYRVIAMDSRDQGRSGDSPGKITYEKMADDLAALLDHLRTGPVYVIGWSDGGIEALLLGIRHPEKVKKIVSMAANLNPSDKALRPEALEFIRSAVKDMPAAHRDTPQGRRELKVTAMMLEEPNIPLDALRSIKAPTLILTGDTDAIDLHHSIDIFQHLENGQLAVFPNATHAIPYDDPILFNGTVERFLRTPFKKKNRINDLMTSIGKMRGQ